MINWKPLHSRKFKYVFYYKNILFWLSLGMGKGNWFIERCIHTKTLIDICQAQCFSIFLAYRDAIKKLNVYLITLFNICLLIPLLNVVQCFIYINKGFNRRNTTPSTLVVSTVFISLIMNLTKRDDKRKSKKFIRASGNNFRARKGSMAKLIWETMHKKEQSANAIPTVKWWVFCYTHTSSNKFFLQLFKRFLHPTSRYFLYALRNWIYK